jgi:adenylate cyclase class 2
MREIEIKAKISDVQSVVDAIAKSGGVLSDSVTHHDRVFGLLGVPGADENGQPWLRIRTETKGDTTKHYFTLKKSITSQLDSIEHETVIDDDAELEKIIEHIGFVPYSDLIKTRRKTKLGDIEVCLDNLGPLGDFIELEKLMADEVDYEAVEKELWEVFTQLGIQSNQQVTDGYDVMMNKYLGKE